MNSSLSSFPPNFTKPQYGKRCFADLPLLTRSLLTGEPAQRAELDPSMQLANQYDIVILLFIDGFGWRFFEKFSEHPWLARFITDGQARQWTSQFPSTTAAHVTAIHTGLPVGQSGVFEWIYYDPHVDDVIAPLLFSHAGTFERDTLKLQGVDPAMVFPTTPTHYEQLQQRGIGSTILQHNEYTPSTYSDAVFRGAEVIPYRTLPEALANLRLLVNEVKTPHYFFLYFDKVDSLCHQYGPNSPQVEAEIDAVLTNLERLLFDKLGTSAASSPAKDVLLLMTADHGMAEVDPATTLYLNRDPRFSSILDSFKQNRQGKPIVPAGCCRDMFLYVQDDRLDEVYALLTHELRDVAAVAKTADLLAHGYFGPTPFSPAFEQRLGDLVILPYLHESVWWYEKGRFDMELYGHHGGLTAQESQIPLLALDLSL